jgi:hypothetical protein
MAHTIPGRTYRLPALSNAKWERFAQGLAGGKSQAEAYELAGYKPSEPHASRLASNGRVVDRVAEILERAAIRVEVTVASLTERLLKIADVAEKTGVDTDGETGQVLGSSSKHLGVVRATIMDIAKLNGLIIDQQQHTGTMTIKTLADFYGGSGPDEPEDGSDA